MFGLSGLSFSRRRQMWYMPKNILCSDHLSQNCCGRSACSVPCLHRSNIRESSILRGSEKFKSNGSFPMSLPLLLLPFYCLKIQDYMDMFCLSAAAAQIFPCLGHASLFCLSSSNVWSTRIWLIFWNIKISKNCFTSTNVRRVLFCSPCRFKTVRDALNVLLFCFCCWNTQTKRIRFTF